VKASTEDRARSAEVSEIYLFMVEDRLFD
jgi:hypothetical protein